MDRSDLANLTAFIAIAEQRSFRAAASRLHVTPSALSHLMRQLEERLGVRLLHRTTRGVLQDTKVRVLEIAPPWVRTELMNSQEAEQAMPLKQFIDQTIAVLGTDTDEILVDAAKPLRANPGPNEHGLVNGFNVQMMAIFAGGRASVSP
jgi:DNA-binding transcriptional LysR family regulator